MPPLPLQRGAAVPERDRLLTGEHVAAAGVGIEHWQLHADRLEGTPAEGRGQLVKHAHY